MGDATHDHDERHPGAEAIPLRAEWLGRLSEAEREALAAGTLDEVDALFDAWMDARGPVGHHGGG